MKRKPEKRIRVRLLAADHPVLRSMAKQAVWQERGGRAIREAGKYQTGGAVIGRTVWVGMPEWARGFGMDRRAIRRTVELAIAGKCLGSQQTALIQSMLADIDEASGARKTDCPF